MAEFVTTENKRTYDKHINRRLSEVLRSTTSRTINLTNAMSATDINNRVNNALHKHFKYGRSIIVQFADGTYNLDAPLSFDGYYGGGKLFLLGNAADNSLGVAKNVFLNFNNGTDGIRCRGNSIYIDVYYMKIRVQTAKNSRGVYFENCAYVRTRYNYLLGTGTGDGRGIEADGCSFVSVRDTYVDNIKYGIASSGSRLLSINNDDNPAGTTPLYGLLAESAGTIGKSGTQPAGSTANELEVDGGEIR